MATYQFSPNGALDTGAELKLVTDGLAASLEDLMVKVQAFLNANQSVSTEIYTQAQTQWNEGQKQMNLAMVQGQRALNEIHAQYVLADNRGAQLFNQSL